MNEEEGDDSRIDWEGSDIEDSNQDEKFEDIKHRVHQNEEEFKAQEENYKRSMQALQKGHHVQEDKLNNNNTTENGLDRKGTPGPICMKQESSNNHESPKAFNEHSESYDPLQIITGKLDELNYSTEDDISEKLEKQIAHRDFAHRCMGRFEVTPGGEITNTPLNEAKSNAGNVGKYHAQVTSTPINKHFLGINETEYPSDNGELIKNLTEKCFLLEQSKHQADMDNEDLQNTITRLHYQFDDRNKTGLEQNLLIRRLKYDLEKEKEDKRVAEQLIAQFKEQLTQLDINLSSEVESKQRLELANRKYETDLHIQQQIIVQLESDVNDLRTNLNTEQESRTIQEELYKNQLRQLELILQDAQKKSHEHAQAVTKIESLDETRRAEEVTRNNLQLELATAKGELSHAVSTLSEIKVSSQAELVKIRDKLENKEGKLSVCEKELMQVQLELEKLKSESTVAYSKLASQLEEERRAKNRAEDGVVSWKTRFESVNREFEQAAAEKLMFEQKQQQEREASAKETRVLEKEIAMLKDQIKQHTDKLDAATLKIESLSQQVQHTSSVLVEKNHEMALVRRDSDEKQITVAQLKEKLANEKESYEKLSKKFDAANERISDLSLELGKQKQELTLRHKESDLKDKSAAANEEKLNTYLMTTKSELQSERSEFQSKIDQLSQTITKLTTDLAAQQLQAKDQDALIQKLKQEKQDTDSKMCNTEAENAIYIKSREDLTTENESLKNSLAAVEQRFSDTEGQKIELERRCSELEIQLDHAVQVSTQTTERLSKATEDYETIQSSKDKLERALSDIKRENFLVDSDLKEERAKNENLVEKLNDANEARQSLEALLSNVKGKNSTLEEKLNSETLHRSQTEREADEHKNLWENEVKSRSKLGLKIMQLEKEAQELKSALDDEKKKTSRALQMKKGADSNIVLYEQRSTQHQKEVSALHSKLKKYQKKLRDFEQGESKLPAIYKQFETLQRQLSSMSEQLGHEQEMRTKSEKTCREQGEELNEYRTKEKVNNYEQDKWKKKCDILEQEILKQRKYFEHNFVPREDIEDYKKDLETKARLDLNKKLHEVNLHLEEQALAREAFEKIRNQKEMNTRKHLEETVDELRDELLNMKRSIHVDLAKKDTSLAEANRYKELYEKERIAKENLSDRVIKANNSLLENQRRLTYEQLRSQLDESYDKSNLRRTLDSSPNKITNFLSPSPDIGHNVTSSNAPYSKVYHSTPMTR